MFAYLHALAKARRYLKKQKVPPDQMGPSRVLVLLDDEPGVRRFDNLFALAAQNRASARCKYRQEFFNTIRQIRKPERRALLRSVWRMLRRVQNLGACVSVGHASARKDQDMAIAEKIARRQGRRSHRDRMAALHCKDLDVHLSS